MLNVVCKAYYKVEGELRGYLPPEFLSLSFPGLECNSIPGPLKKAWYSLFVDASNQYSKIVSKTLSRLLLLQCHRK